MRTVIDLSDKIKAGNLKKKGTGRVTQWNERYFVLSSNSIRYYVKVNEKSNNIMRSFIINNSIIRHVIVLYCKHCYNYENVEDNK